MRFLLRTFSAGFSIADACTLEQVDADLNAHIMPIDAPINHMPRVLCGSDLYARLRCGNRLAIDKLRGDVDAPGAIRLYVNREADIDTLERDAQSGGVPAGYSFAGIVERDGDETRFKAMLFEPED